MNVGYLEDEALKRKERLKALKRGDLKSLNNKNKLTNEEDKDELNSDDKLPPKPLFRNYNPRDDDLKANLVPKPDLIEIKNEIKEQLESGKSKPLIEKEIDLSTLAPQKIDWDLKREAEKRLKLLEKRTQKSIVELIRDRLKSQKNSDLAELVSVGARRDLRKDQTNSQGEDEDESDEDDLNTSQSSLNNNENSQNDDDSSIVNDKQTESKNIYVYEKHEISDDDDYN